MRDTSVIAMLKKGNTIEAIKIYQEMYRVGMAEAKKAVAGLRAGLNL